MKQSTKDKVYTYVVDTTALVAEATPLYAGLEVGLSGISVEHSLDARLKAAGLFYAGLGVLLSKGRELSRNFFNVTDKTNEAVQSIHDSLYFGTFSLGFAPLLYSWSGVTDSKELILGTLCSTAIGFFNGGPSGYALDTYQDLCGIKTCARPSYPSLIKNRSRTTKRTLAALVTAGSLALTGGLYAMKAHYAPGEHQERAVEQVVSSQAL